jgi:hypothetical protein
MLATRTLCLVSRSGQWRLSLQLRNGVDTVFGSGDDHVTGIGTVVAPGVITC